MRNEHAQKGPPGRGARALPEARRDAALAGARGPSGCSVLRGAANGEAPAAGRAGAAREASRACGRSPGERWAEGGRQRGSSRGTHFHFAKWRGQNAKTGKSQPGAERFETLGHPSEVSRGPMLGARYMSGAATRSFRWQDAGGKGREGGQRKVRAEDI